MCLKSKKESAGLRGLEARECDYMSKWLEISTDANGNERIVETLADDDGCSYMYNEVCCNENSQFFGFCLFSEDCEMCSLFESEREMRNKLAGIANEKEEHNGNKVL